MPDEERTEKTGAKLPDAELEVMLAVWQCTPPVTTARLMRILERSHQWKTPTVISFLDRLKTKGFLRAERKGREYEYEPLVSREEYVVPLTEDFFRRVHGASVYALMDALFRNRPFSDSDAAELLRWLEKQV